MARQRKKSGDLAKELGIAPSSLTTRMAGQYPFDVAELEKIARWLGIDIVQLISPRSHPSAA